MSSIKTLIAKHGRKVTIAIIGLENSGKTEFVKRILQTNEHIQATIGSSSKFELQIYGNLSLLTWDLEDTIPQNKSLWRTSILGADALFFFVDSTAPEKFNTSRVLLEELIAYNFPIRLLVLANKSDAPESANIGDIIEALNLTEIDKTKCECDLFKFSAKTGEGMYAIEAWINKVIFKQKERIIDYVKIAACVSLCEETSDLTEVLLDPNPKISLITTMHELKRKATIFSRTMRIHGAGEEVIEIANYKIVLVKGKDHVIALVINMIDSVPRAIEIARNILKLMKSYCGQPAKMSKTIHDLYPLDV
ncbi:MAG: ADP-ribosylation factor-like protein [Candidatus Heimdallarchaeota archaeon]